MSVHYPSDVFFSISGLQKDRFLLDKTGRIRHGVVLTEEETGVLRAIHLDIGRNPENPAQLYIRGHYLLNAGRTSNQENMFLEASLEEHSGLIFVNKANFLGYTVDHSKQDQVFAFASALNQLIEHVARKHEWTNFIKLFQQSGVSVPTIGRVSLPGLYPNGEIKSYANHPLKKHADALQDIDEKKGPIYPALFFHSIAGCGPEHYSGEKNVSHSFTARDEDTGELYVWTYSYAQGKTPLNVEMLCNLNVHSKEGTRSRPLYKLTAQPQSGQEDSVCLKEIQIYHPNAQDQMDRIPPSDSRAVADALKTIRMYNRDIRAGIEGMEEDFRRTPEDRRLYFPSDILMLTGLTKSLIPEARSSRNGRFVFTPIGGQNNREAFSIYDTHIGGNSYRFDYYLPQKAKPDSLLLDTGALFHDQYDLTFTNVGRYLYHRFDKTHEPEVDTRAVLYTHRHKDHLAQLAYIVKKGYLLPPMIMPPLVLRQIKREMHELKIEKTVQQEIFNKAIVIEPLSIPADASLAKPHKKKIGKEEVLLYWEHLPGDRLGQYERYPVAHIGNFKIRIGPMPHSDPGFMYEVITPAGGQLHTGDFKLDPTLQLYQAPYAPWLKAVTSTAVSVDSTGATKKSDEETPSELEIQQSLVKLFKRHPDNRFICPVLGSNTSRLTTLIASMGHAGKRFLIVDGKALEDLVDDLESVHRIKEWARRVHGVTIAKQGTKEAHRVYDEESAGNYVITATGTQDEPYSSMNRAMRDWLPEHRFRLEQDDIIVPLQGPIPVGNNQKLRKSARYFAEAFHGIKYILPEEIEKEADLVLAGSGHTSPKDLRNFYGMISCRVSYPVHGGPEQLKAGQEIARSAGLQSYVVNAHEGYETYRNGTAQLFRREIGETIAIRNRQPTPEQFYLKRNFSATVVPVKPRDMRETGTLLNDFERTISKILGKGVYNATSQSMGFSLSRTFNISSANGYLTGRYAFGIERYGMDVYRAKRIGGYAAVDTETTGTDPDLDYIVQLSLAAWTRDKKLVLEKELLQEPPENHTHHPEALIVTNTNPLESKKGDPLVLFSEKVQRLFKAVKSHSKTAFIVNNPVEYAQQPNARVKTIIVAHNLKFDDRFIRKTLGESIYDRVRPHSTDGNIAIDTRHLARLIHAVYPEKFNVRKKIGSNFLDFTLKALCEENGVPYDDKKAHASALYDAHRAMHLFWKMEEIAPEITAQMILNADSSTGHLLNDMVGMDTGFGGPYPVFSYVSTQADRPDLRLGSFVGTVGGGRYAIIMNMTKSSKEIFGLCADELIEKIKDRKDDSLELVDLRNNPMILPAKFFYQQKVSRKYPRETIDRRAHALKEHLNFVSPQSGWKNIAEKIEDSWKDNQSKIFTALIMSEEPDMKAPVSSMFREKNNFMTGSIFKNLSQRAHATFNPVSQKTFKYIKEYRDQVISHLEGKEADISHSYKNLMGFKGISEEQKFLVNNIHYDLKASDIDVEGMTKVKEFRAFHGAQTAIRASEALQRLDQDPARTASLIGNDRKKRKLFKVVRDYVDERAKIYVHNDASRNFVHPWRGILRDSPKLDAA